VGNVAERGPLAIVGGRRQHSEISLEIKVYRDVDSYILKPEITGKQQSQNFQKTQKATTYWKTKKYWIPKYKQNGGSVFAFTCQGGG